MIGISTQKVLKAWTSLDTWKDKKEMVNFTFHLCNKPKINTRALVLFLGKHFLPIKPFSSNFYARINIIHRSAELLNATIGLWPSAELQHALKFDICLLVTGMLLWISTGENSSIVCSHHYYLVFHSFFAITKLWFT